MSGHTPGQWHYHRRGGPNIYSEDGTEIGHINYVDDGYLIAAAPDLLALADAVIAGQSPATLLRLAHVARALATGEAER